MKIYLLVVGTMLCFVTVFGRNTADKSNVAEYTDATIEQLENIKKTLDNSSHERHRRKRWHMNYGYNYPPPPGGYYPDERRDYERDQQDLMPQIIKLLEEITSYLKYPPQPSYPQPIYIPYPVAMPPQLRCRCPAAQQPNITNRFPEMDDTNQNWGFVDFNDIQAAIDENRPVSFYPVKPVTTTKRPPPVVDNSNSQAAESFVTRNPFADEVPSSNSKAPSKCDATALSCCTQHTSRSQQRRCFSNAGCEQTFKNGDGCSQDAISKILGTFSKTYSVVN